MTEVTAEEVKPMVQLGVAGGPAVGFGIKHNIESVKIGESGASVTTKLDEKSLENAEQRTGIFRSPHLRTPKSKSMDNLSNGEAKNDSTYASFFSKPQLKNSSQMIMSDPNGNNTARYPNYKSLVCPSKGPLARVKNRRHMFKLRDTFNSIAKNSKQTTTIKFENLPQEVKRRLAKMELNKGNQDTKFGDNEKSLKVAGIKPETLPKEHNVNKKKKERQWAKINTELIPSG